MTKIKRILLECTGTWENDAETGIQRVVRNIIKESPVLAEDFNIKSVPVILKFNHFWYANKKSSVKSFWFQFRFFLKKVYLAVRPFVMRLSPSGKLEELLLSGSGRLLRVLYKMLSIILYPVTLIVHFKREIVPSKRDILLLLDSSWIYPIWPAVKKAKANGAVIGLVVYDLIQITHQNFFSPAITQRFTVWFEEAIKHVDFFIGISKTVQIEIQKYLRQNHPQYLSKAHLDSFFLGCELDNVAKEGTIRKELEVLFEKGGIYTTVGTIEPRKNHKYLLDAFDLIWKQGFDTVLCIIGKLGWRNGQIRERILKHPKLNKNLFVYNDIDDTELNYCYKHSKAMIFPSHAEGFGLPIVESLRNGLPVIASDIPIHREVGKDFCTYFDISEPSCLARIIINIEKTGKMPQARSLLEYSLPKWKDSCRELLTKVLYLCEEL